MDNRKKEKLGKREELIRRVTAYLSHHGDVRFHDYEFIADGTGCDGVVYASVEMIMDEKLADGLEDAINKEMNPNGNGAIPADIRFIGIDNQENGKVRYSAEIVPRINFNLPANHNIPQGSTREREKVIYATDLFLRGLPKALSNLRQKKICLLDKKG